MACLECTQRCLLFHKRKNPSPIVTSFFKVMIGAQYAQLLYLPPKFAPTVSALVNQKTHLEDSSGRQWKVTISKIDGSFAFQQGWNAFALDHGLKVGDFVVFNYIIESHFVVKIYTDTGCEKLYFSENSNQNIRTRTNRNFIPEAGPCNIEKSSNKKQSLGTSLVSASTSQSQCKVNDAEKAPIVTENNSNCENSYGGPQPVSTADYIEVPYYMINRDLGGTQGVNRSPIFDLFEFEMPKNNSNADGSKTVAVGGKGSPHHADTSLGIQSEAGLVDDEDPVAEGIASIVAPSDHPLTASAGKPEKNGVNSSHMLNGETKIRQSAEERGNTQSGEMTKMVKQEPVEMTRELCIHKEMIRELCIHKEMIQEICGEEPKAIDGEHGQSSNVIVKDNDEVHEVLKTDDSIGISSPGAVSISCLVGSNSQSLELPTCSLTSFGSLKLEGR